MDNICSNYGTVYLSVEKSKISKLLSSWTLRLVIQGEWPKLGQIVKTRVEATLQRCCQNPSVEPLTSTLRPLVKDPWGHPVLKHAISAEPVTDEQGMWRSTHTILN